MKVTFGKVAPVEAEPITTQNERFDEPVAEVSFVPAGPPVALVADLMPQETPVYGLTASGMYDALRDLRDMKVDYIQFGDPKQPDSEIFTVFDVSWRALPLRERTKGHEAQYVLRHYAEGRPDEVVRLGDDMAVASEEIRRAIVASSKPEFALQCNIKLELFGLND